MFVFLFDFKYSQGQNQQSPWLSVLGAVGIPGEGAEPSPAPAKGCQHPGQLRNLCTDLSQWMGETQARQGGTQRPE